MSVDRWYERKVESKPYYEGAEAVMEWWRRKGAFMASLTWWQVMWINFQERNQYRDWTEVAFLLPLLLVLWVIVIRVLWWLVFGDPLVLVNDPPYCIDVTPTP